MTWTKMIIHFFLFLAVALGCCAPLCHGASYAPSAVLGVAAALSVAALSVGVDAAGAAAAVKPSKLRRLADDAMVGGKLDEAVRLLTQACKAERNHQNHYKRFRILLRKKKHAPALADLDAALEIKVDFVSARTQRAKLLQKLGRCDAAYADATYAERSLAQEVFAAGGAATKKGGRVQKKLLKAQKDAQSTQRCALSMQAGHTARAQGNWDQCIHQLGRALEMASLAPALSVARAECQLAKGNLHEAAADAAKALKVDKGHLPALLLRARAFYRLDEKDVALRHIRQLLRSDPAHKEGKTLFRTMKKAKKHVQRAEAAIARGELTEAAAELLASANVDPTHTIVRKALLTRRCELYVQAKLNDEALLACDEAVAVDGASVGRWWRAYMYCVHASHVCAPCPPPPPPPPLPLPLPPFLYLSLSLSLSLPPTHQPRCRGRT